MQLITNRRNRLYHRPRQPVSWPVNECLAVAKSRSPISATVHKYTAVSSEYETSARLGSSTTWRIRVPRSQKTSELSAKTYHYLRLESSVATVIARFTDVLRRSLELTGRGVSLGIESVECRRMPHHLSSTCETSSRGRSRSRSAPRSPSCRDRCTLLPIAAGHRESSATCMLRNAQALEADHQ